MSTRLSFGSHLIASLLVALFGALLAGACATAGAKKPPAGLSEPDKFLYDHGNEAMSQKKWTLAVEYYRQLVDTYPQSLYRASAKLGMGDAYMGQHSAESFVLAGNEYKEFLSFYPTHEYAYYAQFKEAMTHYYQMRASMRDQTETRAAIADLQTFLDKYPRAPVVDEARKRLREAKDRLDDWDYGVAVQYFHLRWYPGVVNRLQPLLKNDPGYSNRDGAYFYLAEAFMKI
ncbi:MAG TPA: outer membrane protein assembly factor BamD, partial [Vicinamibacterales bacterium]